MIRVTKRKYKIPMRELVFTASRSSGPGGQNVNKSNTKVTLKWNIGSSTALSEAEKKLILRKLKNKIAHTSELILSCDRFSSQAQNKRDLIERLDKVLRGALRLNKKRVISSPNREAKESRLARKKKTALKKKLRQKNLEASDEIVF